MIAPLLARRICPGLIAATILTTGVLYAGEDSMSQPTTQGSGAAKLTAADIDVFIKDASQANFAEVALADLAEHKSQSPEVKEFARMMKKDHSAANEQLRPIAQSHGVKMSDSLDATHKKMYDQLEQLSGTQFDQQFMKDMLKGHEKVIRSFDRAAQQTLSPDVKDYAQATLPTLNQHMHHAKQTAKAVGIDAQTISSLTKDSHATGGTIDESQKESGVVKPDSGTKPDQREEMPR